MGSDAKVGGVITEKSSQIEILKDTISKDATVTSTSQKLEALLGVAVPDNAMAVFLHVGDEVVRYNPDGTASAANASLPSVYTVWGNKTKLDTVELQSASSVSVGIIVQELDDEYQIDTP